jgi:hypothetical protein
LTACPFRARETYLVQGTDAFEEVFEIAEPNKPFEVYARTRLTRVKKRWPNWSKKSIFLRRVQKQLRLTYHRHGSNRAEIPSK